MATAFFTLAGEWLRVVEEPTQLFGRALPGIPGLRLVLLSLALLPGDHFFSPGAVGTA